MGRSLCTAVVAEEEDRESSRHAPSCRSRSIQRIALREMRAVHLATSRDVFSEVGTTRAAADGTAERACYILGPPAVPTALAKHESSAALSAESPHEAEAIPRRYAISHARPISRLGVKGGQNYLINSSDPFWPPDNGLDRNWRGRNAPLLTTPRAMLLDIKGWSGLRPVYWARQKRPNRNPLAPTSLGDRYGRSSRAVVN